jgi:hypothetical protein
MPRKYKEKGGHGQASLSAIYFTAMADAMNKHDANRVCDFVDNAIVSHPDAPVITAANQFATSGRTRVCRERLDRIDHTSMYIQWEFGKVFLYRSFK